MSVPVLTFFNNKGGVGKTSLVYHLAWTYALLGKRVIVADLDPQANLTAAFLEEDKIELLWNEQRPGSTIYRCVEPLTSVADILKPELQDINENLSLIPGDVELSSFEDTLSSNWPLSLGESTLYRPMRILSSFWQIMQMAAGNAKADIILVDIGPNLGAINRSILLSTDYVVIPLGADLFSIQGLKNLGPTLREWRRSWKKRVDNWNEKSNGNNRSEFKLHEFELPKGKMKSIGYLCQQHSIRLDRPVKSYNKWVQRIPSAYRKSILEQGTTEKVMPEKDPHCLGTIKHYRSLVPMAQEFRKPIFNLTSADGAIGSHANAVTDAWKDFRQLAEKIQDKMS